MLCEFAEMSELAQIITTIEFVLELMPAWAEHVQRWYQLDGPSFSLVEAYWRFKDQLPLPDIIFFTSSSGSNETDAYFCQSGGDSPARFVHTLPNIRLAPMLQLMKRDVPAICLQKGQLSWSQWKDSTKELLERSKYKSGWLINIEKSDALWHESDKRKYCIMISVFGEQNGNK